MNYYLGLLLGYFFSITLIFQATATDLLSTCDLLQEDLEGHDSNNPPAGWDIQGGYILPNDANSGNVKAGLNSIGDKIILAPFTCPSEICFFWRASSLGANFDVDIEFSQDNGMTWTIAQTLMTNGSNSPITYAEVCIPLPTELYEAPFSNILLRFHQSRRSGGSFYFDDVCVSSGICSAAPTQLTFQEPASACIAIQSPFTLTVCATNEMGTIDPTFTETIAIQKNTGNGTLNGLTNVMATEGCAVFSNLSFDQPGIYTISATSTSLTGISNDILIENFCTTIDTLKIMSYNVLNFPNGSNCTDNITVAARWDTLRKIIDYVQPDVLMVCELQTEEGANRILNNALNTNGNTTYQRANFVTNQSGGNPNLNNMFFYRSDKMTLQKQTEILTNVRDIGQYTVFLKDPNLEAHQDTTFIDFYMAHLKAGNTPTDAQARAEDCLIFQNYLNLQPSARNAVLGGDFNLYSSNEAAYQTLLSGTYPFFDPINIPGDWESNFNFRAVHTQAVRDATDLMSLDCGATGGLDSRFDFLLATGSVLDGTQHLQYLSNTYQTLGNNGSIYNDAINDPSNNSVVPREILNALYYMSDHLPIVMEVQVNYPLPTTLALESLILKGTITAQGIRLDWENTYLTTTSSWILEKSRDGKHFEVLVHQAGASTFFEDTKPFYGANYFRLKQINSIGEERYARVILMEWKGPSNLDVFPNPVRDVLYFSNLFLVENKTIFIYNAMGQRVDHFFIKKKEASISVVDLPKGIYFIKVEGMDGVARFLKQ